MESCFEVFDVELGGDAGPLVNAGSLINHLDARDLPGGYSCETHRSRRGLVLQRFHRANEGLLRLTRRERRLARRDHDLLNRLPERFHEVVVLHEALLDLGKSLIRGLQLG